MNDQEIIEKVRRCLVEASSVFSEDKKKAYEKAISNESSSKSRWVLEKILENANVAEQNNSPMCDDTGIPHVVLEIGKGQAITGKLLDLIEEGVKKGLQSLPGRPMAILGNEIERIEQTKGLDNDPGAVEIAPIQIRRIEENVTRVNILMFGGGPAIRGKTYRVFHKHNIEVVKNEIVSWAKESVAALGCTPCTLGIGIGRSAYEASALMVQALIDGNYEKQTDFERDITRLVNEAGVGALGLRGDTTVLGTFIKVGAQRASGVRIVCMRPCCCFEPRMSSVEL